MKKLLLVVAVLISVSAVGATKCQSDGRGGVCCWETDKDGIFTPIGC